MPSAAHARGSRRRRERTVPAKQPTAPPWRPREAGLQQGLEDAQTRCAVFSAAVS